MIRPHERLFRRSLLLLDLVVMAAAYIGAFELRRWLPLASEALTLQLPGAIAALAADAPRLVDAETYRLLLLAMLPVFGLSLYAVRAHDFRASYRQTALRYAKAVGAGLAVMVAMVFLLKLESVARSFVVLYGICAFAALSLGRIAVMETVTFLRHKRVDGHRLLVAGADTSAVELADALLEQQGPGVRLLGYLRQPGEQPDPRAEPLLGEVAQLDRVLDSRAVDEVVFVAYGHASEALGPALQVCEDRGVDLSLTLPPMLPQGARVSLAAVEGFDLPLLNVQRTPAGELPMAVKRVMDVLLSGVMLLCAAPVMLAAALAIRLDSKGPVFFVQERCGRNGRRFPMLKFRSMVVDAEAQRAALEASNEMDGPVFKMRHDPRITAVGRFLRRSSIDELPQLINVLLGDMSLIGPRPPLPSEVEAYEPWQRRRLSMKPGLTGLWQVSGRNRVDFQRWMELDLRYIDQWSLWLDVQILVRTVPAVISGSGAS